MSSGKRINHRLRPLRPLRKITRVRCRGGSSNSATPKCMTTRIRPNRTSTICWLCRKALVGRINTRRTRLIFSIQSAAPSVSARHQRSPRLPAQAGRAPARDPGFRLAGWSRYRRPPARPGQGVAPVAKYSHEFFFRHQSPAPGSKRMAVFRHGAPGRCGSGCRVTAFLGQKQIDHDVCDLESDCGRFGVPRTESERDQYRTQYGT